MQVPKQEILIFWDSNILLLRNDISRSGMSRLMIAIMNPGHKFGDMKAIQKELSEIVKDLAPKDCSNQIPFMTDGDEVGGKVS